MEDKRAQHELNNSNNKKKRARRHMSTKAKVRRYAEDVIMACLVIIMLFSAWKIYTIIKDYRDNQSLYDTIAGESRDGEFTGDIDFDALRKINPDVKTYNIFDVESLEATVLALKNELCEV